MKKTISEIEFKNLEKENKRLKNLLKYYKNVTSLFNKLIDQSQMTKNILETINYKLADLNAFYGDILFEINTMAKHDQGIDL